MRYTNIERFSPQLPRMLLQDGVVSEVLGSLSLLLCIRKYTVPQNIFGLTPLIFLGDGRALVNQAPSGLGPYGLRSLSQQEERTVPQATAYLIAASSHDQVSLRCTQCIMLECLLTILIYRGLAYVGRAPNDKSGSRHSSQLHYVHSCVSRMRYGPGKQGHVAPVFQNLRPPSRLARLMESACADTVWSRLLHNLLLLC